MIIPKGDKGAKGITKAEVRAMLPKEREVKTCYGRYKDGKRRIIHSLKSERPL